MPNSYESLATISGNGVATTLQFGSISQSYKHLQIRGVTRTARATINDGVFIYFNGDNTDANYTSYVFDGDGGGGQATAGVILGNGGVYNRITVAPGANATANVMASVIVDILDYTSSKVKQMRAYGGNDRNGAGDARMCSGLWLSTSAINSITFWNNNNSAFTSTTTFALYGIKDS